MRITLQERAEGFWGLANEYRAASDVLFDASATSYRPALFLLCHAIELALKSILILGGGSDKELMAHGHDMPSCLHAVGEGRFSDNSRKVVFQLGEYYKHKELEYFFPKAKTFGNLDEIRSGASEILERAFSEIMQAGMSQSDESR